MNKTDLRNHLTMLKRASRDDLDVLLHDLLCKAWPSKIVQNN